MKDAKQYEHGNDDPRYRLILENTYNIVLYMLYRKLFRRIDFWINTGQIITGSAAFALIFSGQKNLAIAGALISIFALIGLMVAPADKAAQSHMLFNRFSDLYAHSDNLTNEEFERKLSLLQFEDYPIKWDWVEEVADRDSLVMCDREDATLPLTFSQKILHFIFL